MSQKENPFIRGYSPTYLHTASVMRNLTFRSGQHGRCWQISSAHITEDAAGQLYEMADIATPSSFLFTAFRIPYSPAIGVLLAATPWTDESLTQARAITAAQLRKEHLDKDLPAHLVDIIHLAALADVSVLIFDPEAPVLDGLPTFDEPNGAESDDD